MNNKSSILVGFALGFVTALVIVGAFAAGFMLMRPSAPVPEVPVVVAAQPPETAPSGPRLVIVHAEYGDPANWPGTDVTDKVKSVFNGTSLSIDATNDNFGDPAPGILKALRVTYKQDGRERMRSVPEGETLKIAIVSGPVRLVIKKAVYGDLPDGPATDVTEKVADAADGGSLLIGANNDQFGDPAPGIAKKLRVEYTSDGKAGSKVVDEGETLTISTDGG